MMIPPETFHITVGAMLRKQSRIRPVAVAIEEGDRCWTFGELNTRVNRLAHALAARGVRRGDRLAILSENCHAYLELDLAAAKLGAIVACLNWRLKAHELRYCIQLVSPAVVFVSSRYLSTLREIDHGVPIVFKLGDDYETALAESSSAEPTCPVDPEDGLVILYTSGTTGFPKGVLISHRAIIARALLNFSQHSFTSEDVFVAWPPLLHMAAGDFSLATLMFGGKVIVQDGFDADRLIGALEREQVSWLHTAPGMISPLIDGLRRRQSVVKQLKLVGAMADLVPPHQIAELTALLRAPFLNTFGSTEAGPAPCHGNSIPVGEIPKSFSKRESGFCEIRLVDASDHDVPVGVPGELLIRGPTLFSGYWSDPETNTKDFRGGWFHSGDMLVRRPDGLLDFVDRVKYLIKSGGENIYPAEIERVLLADPLVIDAVVVRKKDEKWGEVPVAFIAAKDSSLTEAGIIARCSKVLPRFKHPKEIRFVSVDAFPRGGTGKIQRHEVEKWLTDPK